MLGFQPKVHKLSRVGFKCQRDCTLSHSGLSHYVATYKVNCGKKCFHSFSSLIVLKIAYLNVTFKITPGERYCLSARQRFFSKLQCIIYSRSTTFNYIDKYHNCGQPFYLNAWKKKNANTNTLLFPSMTCTSYLSFLLCFCLPLQTVPISRMTHRVLGQHHLPPVRIRLLQDTARTMTLGKRKGALACHTRASFATSPSAA